MLNTELSCLDLWRVSFSQKLVNTLNKLPVDVVTELSVGGFKRRLD